MAAHGNHLGSQCPRHISYQFNLSLWELDTGIRICFGSFPSDSHVKSSLRTNQWCEWMGGTVSRKQQGGLQNTEML